MDMNASLCTVKTLLAMLFYTINDLELSRGYRCGGTGKGGAGGRFMTV